MDLLKQVQLAYTNALTTIHENLLTDLFLSRLKEFEQLKAQNYKFKYSVSKILNLIFPFDALAIAANLVDKAINPKYNWIFVQNCSREEKIKLVINSWEKTAHNGQCIHDKIEHFYAKQIADKKIIPETTHEIQNKKSEIIKLCNEYNKKTSTTLELHQIDENLNVIQKKLFDLENKLTQENISDEQQSSKPHLNKSEIIFEHLNENEIITKKRKLSTEYEQIIEKKRKLSTDTQVSINDEIKTKNESNENINTEIEKYKNLEIILKNIKSECNKLENHVKQLKDLSVCSEKNNDFESNILTDYQLYALEYKIFSLELDINGRIDALFLNKNNGKLIVVDWKTGGSDGLYVDYNRVGKSLFCNYGASKYNKFSLQLNIYRRLIELYYEKEVESMYIVLVNNDKCEEMIEAQYIEEIDHLFVEETFKKFCEN